MKHVADEGTSEPFVARLMNGALELRNLSIGYDATSDKDRELRRRHFDDRYMPVLDALGSARNHEKAIREILVSHKAKVADGSIISRQQNAVQIGETVDSQLQDHFASFLSASARAAKLLQALLSYLDVEIGMLFQKEPRFLRELERLRESGAIELADYLAGTRKGWSEPLIKRRHVLEHEGWRLAEARYVGGEDGPMTFIEPVVDGLPVSEFSSKMLDQLLGFVEDALAFAVQRRIGEGLDLIDTPRAERDSANVKRFRLGSPALQPNQQFWRLRYTGLGLSKS
ncbi:MAG: hypothetical protein Q7R30_17840 [Acidobacteriota bacterium]|nr:hypothetical protein [Acidobacteriota bacterium]